jgi:hypothetical protein
MPVKLPVNQFAVIIALYVVTQADGTVIADATVPGSQQWSIDGDTVAVLAPQADGSAKLSALTPESRGSVVVSYTAKGINADGVEVPLVAQVGTGDIVIVDAVTPPPAAVEIPLQISLQGV